MAQTAPGAGRFLPFTAGTKATPRIWPMSVSWSETCSRERGPFVPPLVLRPHPVLQEPPLETKRALSASILPQWRPRSSGFSHYPLQGTGMSIPGHIPRGHRGHVWDVLWFTMDPGPHSEDLSENHSWIIHEKSPPPNVTGGCCSKQDTAITGPHFS